MLPAVLRLGILALAGLAYPRSAFGQSDELRLAAQLDAEHKCDEADRLYQQALAKAPVSVSVLNNVGNHYLICDQPDKAELYFVRLLKINASHTNSNLQLARLATQRKQGAIALGYLSNVKDTSPAVRLLRAEASEYAGRHAEALEILHSLQPE